MKINKGFWIALVILFVWLLLAWFVGPLLGIKPPAVWYLRAGLSLLGIAGFIGYLLLRPKKEEMPLGESAAIAGNEIDYNFNEASKRIQAATGIKQLNSLPAVFVLGDSGSAKTTTLAQCGIEAEVVAGQAMQANMVVPTTSVNLWYSRNTLFIDPSGAVLADAGARRKLFKKFLPVHLNSLLASKNPPTRSVLLTVDCDLFLQSGGANAVAAKARDYQTILGELSRELGSSFPVYVLFTKTDRIPYFREFVDSLTEAEVAEVMGLSLPLTPVVQGSYAETQSVRVDNAFQTLYYSLADKRPVYLGRERAASNLPNIYEFPREFSKLRPLLVQFLIDLCRPSQLGTTPFLRGFYFSGIRPVVINDVAPAAQMSVVPDDPFDPGATSMFNRMGRVAPVAEMRPGGSRKIPQWVYLRTLFPGVLLADRVGSAAAQSNVKVNFVRQLAMATVAALALFVAGWWTISFRNNSQLIHEANEAASAVPSMGLASGQLASTDDLKRLSRVRDTLSILNDYEKDGAPLSYRAFLYKGSAIRRPLRETYYALFRRLLLQPTQQTLMDIAKSPGDAKDKDVGQYDKVYRVLKAYLITTSHPEKTWSDFVPVLMQHWAKNQNVDGEKQSLARSNFNFYADELPVENPYPTLDIPNQEAVTNARSFLNSYPLEESIYRQMLDEAAGKAKSYIFNRDVPGSSDVVRNTYEVKPWFLKAAYLNFQKELQNHSAKDEDWVLGDQKGINADRNQIRAGLGPRYDNDYIKVWREFLSQSNDKVNYESPAGASMALMKLGGPQSVLMQLFCVASRNTSVPGPRVTAAFQPVQLIASQDCDTKLVSDKANPYVGGLTTLGNALTSIGSVENASPDSLLQVQVVASQAQASESALELGFAHDPSDPGQTVLNTSARLLKDPLSGLGGIVERGKTGKINAAAGAMCASISSTFRKYPFNSASHEDATLQEVNEALNPQAGKLWAFVDGDVMKPMIQKAGSQYAAIPGANPAVTSAFLSFVNRAAALKQALYHGDATAGPGMTFNIKPLPSPDIDHVVLAIDGATLSTDPKSGLAKDFPWPGSQEFALTATYGRDIPIVPHLGGLWAAWRGLEGRGAQRVGDSVQWTVSITNEGPVIVNGHPLVVRFGLDPITAQVLRSQFFSGLGCPAKAAQ